MKNELLTGLADKKKKEENEILFFKNMVIDPFICA